MSKFSFSKSGSSSGGRTANVKTPSFSFDSSTKLKPISSSQATSMLNSSGGKLGLDISGLGSPSSISVTSPSSSGGGGGGISQRQAAQKAQEEVRRQREFLKDLQKRKYRNEQLGLDKENRNQQLSLDKRLDARGVLTNSTNVNPAIAAHREHDRKLELIRAKQIGELADAEAMKVAGAFQALGGMLS